MQVQIRIIEVSDKRGSDNRGSTVLWSVIPMKIYHLNFRVLSQVRGLLHVNGIICGMCTTWWGLNEILSENLFIALD